MAHHDEGSGVTPAIGVEAATNLPPAMTSFVGRETELREVGAILGQARLVTVTGPPGAGKTRLATELGENLRDGFAGGVWFVDLAPITDPRLMLTTTAEVLGCQSSADRSPLEALEAHLRTRHVLLVLDNFEHIVDAATDLGALLTEAPTVRILVTSRTPIRISGEHEYALTPLGLPPPSASADVVARSDAVELFVRRTSAIQPTFRLDDQNAADVSKLCRRLDGLPLAIELAAARVKVLPIASILDRLDHRLTLLTDGPRNAPARHRSLRAAVTWSYDLLEPASQRLFRRLSVFRGGWTIEGASAVGDLASDPETVDALGLLLDASLVLRQVGEAPTPRFTMLETLREFAAERLDDAGDEDTARARHAAFYVALAERREADLTGADQASALDDLAIEHDNARVALEYLVGAEPEGALRLAAALWRFWQMRGHLREGAGWLRSGLLAAGDDAPDEIRAKALAAAGGLAYWLGDMAETQEYYERTLAIRRVTGDEVTIANALYDLAFALGPFNRPPPEDPRRTEEALRLAQEAEAVYGGAADEPGIAKSGWLFGTLMLYRDMATAERLLAAAVERFRHLNDPFGLGWALRTYGLALLGNDDLAGASQAFGEALRLFTAAHDGSAMGMLLDDFASVATAEGDTLRAARLKGAASNLRDMSEAAVANASDAPWLRHASAKPELTDRGAIDQALAEGQAMSQSEATTYALQSDAAVVEDGALRVTALGPFLVERAGHPVSHWGGLKAGSRQALAMFAFLLDRNQHGVRKDEFLEVIWPDADVTQGDLNFHRTLNGLRSTLEPGKPPGSGSAVSFENGRYRLSQSAVGWFDAAEFEQRLLHAALATDDLAAIRGLESARALYRGDYLDDCPLYGDSGFVEERRRFLRARLVDALVGLGQRYEARGDNLLAAARHREALAVSGGDCQSAEAGLQRLGVAEG